MYSLLYPTTSVIRVSRFFHESKQIVINNEECLSCSSRSKRSPAITACWPGVVGIDRYGEAPLRIGVALSFFRHEVALVNGPDAASTTFHTIAKVKWYTDHPRGSTFHPLIKVCATTFDSESNASFIPVSRIAGHVATAKSNVQFDYGEDIVLIAVPLLKTVLSLHYTLTCFITHNAITVISYLILLYYNTVINSVPILQKYAGICYGI